MEIEQELSRLEAILYNDRSYRALLQKLGKDAQGWLDLLQLVVDHPNISRKFRSSIFITMNVRQIGEHPVAGGAFGDVWKGSIGKSSDPVCLKVVKVYLASNVQQLLKDYLREAIVWKQLKHPNLLPFLGIYYLDDSRQRFCLVSPWMERGTLVQFLKTADPNDIRPHSLAHDVAAGLAYLHSKKVVHGDLKGVNILITPEMRACIADFGLSRVMDATSGLNSINSTTRPAGTARWLAPELVMGDGRTSEKSDVYAYGGVCYEIFTGRVPFYELPNDAAVVLHVLQGTRPSRPADVLELHDGIWTIMEACWSADASSRLSAGDILALLIDMDTLSAIQPASDWKDSAFTEEIWNNLRRSSYDSGVIDSLLRTVETVSNQSEEIEFRGRAAGGRMKQHDILGYVARHRSPVPLESPEQSPLPSPSRTSPSFSPSRPALNIDDDISALLKGITIGRDPNTSSLPEQRQASPPTVSLEEDIKRLLEECTIGKSSATSLAQALSTPMPKVMAERRRWRSFLKEYHSRCLSSQEIIASQIPWAIATANCSRRPDREEKTTEEELLAELLDVNEKLDRVLAQYEDAHI